MTAEPVFVCGLGRSGTSWLANSLGQSSELVYLRETWLLYRLQQLGDWHGELYRDWTGFTPWQERGLDPPAFLRHLGRFYRGLLDDMAGGGRVLEKTPEWNILYFDTLRQLFPGACFVVIYRDGRNYVASTEAKALREGKAFDFETSCRTWAKATDIIHALPDIVPNAKVHVLRYEDLIGSFEQEFAAVCRFIDIAEFSPPAHAPNSAFANASTVDEFNQRWKPWSRDQRSLFKCNAGPQLIDAGYEISNEVL